jgi:putative DNA primase/helicase
MEFFIGYIQTTSQKKPIEAFKNKTADELLTLEKAEKLNGYAGILAPGVILVDVDDFGQSEILLDIIEALEIRCRVYKTTRGKHFLFKNTNVEKNGTHLKLACGLEADIKLGANNSYEILKYNNVKRPIIYDKYPEEEYDELPKWLLPVKTTTDFLNMEKGDGRNQAFFNYILTLNSYGFTKEETKECIHIINNYVLKDKLSESELDVILRDDAFPKEELQFFKGNTFLFDNFAKYLQHTYSLIKLNNQLHLYKDGVYIYAGKALEAEMIKHISRLSKAKRKEVYDYLDLIVTDTKLPSSAQYIAFRNGIYNVETDEFTDFDPKIVITNKIDWNYNPTAYSNVVDNMFNKLACGDTQIRSLLEEMIGYCFYRRNELGKAFILTGDRSNGKSTFLDLLIQLLGVNNISALDIAELGDRFKTAELFNKLANIGDDIGDEFIPNPAVFKKVATGERINAERKGQDPFDFNPYVKPIYSANDIPRIRDKTGAVIRRLVIIPFNATFSPDDADFDPYIKYKLRTDEAMEYCILLGIAGLKRVLKNRKFTTNKSIDKELEEYEERNNPILLFFKETNSYEIENQITSDVYMKYSVFCSENNFQPMSNIEFSKQIRKQYNLEIIDKKINGKKFRIFTRKED